MRSLKLTLFFLIVGIAVFLFQSRVSSQSQEKPNPQKPDLLMLGCSVVDPIDECIQELFSKADFRFGMTRVPTRTSHIKYFAPSTPKEVQMVKELEADGWEVGFYLAGRRILGEKPDVNAIKLFADGHSVIGGPISITGALQKGANRSQLAMPIAAKLWDEGQKAMRAFESSNRYEFSVGKWTVEARPIRARQDCLKCHNNTTTPPDNSPISSDFAGIVHAHSKTPIKVGDALGVAMYAYTRKQ